MAGRGFSWQSIEVFAGLRYLDCDMGRGQEPFSELSTNGPLLSLMYRGTPD